MDKSADQRRNKYKNKDAFQSDQVRSRRQKHTVEIRKQKREENLSKRRNMSMNPAVSMSDSEDEFDAQAEPEVNRGRGNRAEIATERERIAHFEIRSTPCCSSWWSR